MRIVPTLYPPSDARSMRDADQTLREPRFDDGALGEPAGAIPLTVGEMLMRDGLLDAKGVERILALQERKGLRFGEAALKLRLVSSKDLERTLAVQFLHPCIDTTSGNLSRELTALYKPSSRQVEVLRQQRSVLMQYWFATHPALAIVGPGHGDGRSYYAANMAVLFAQLGRQTLLIDGDMRRARQHKFFDVENRTGLSQVLAGRARALQVVKRVSAINTLAVLPAGSTPPNPLELLDRGGMSAALKELSSVFSVIIVDTPAGRLHGDARVLANSCGGVLMLLRRHRTRLREAKGLAAQLLRTDVKLVGTVLNRY